MILELKPILASDGTFPKEFESRNVTQRFLHAALITITTPRLDSTSCHSNESTEENTRPDICGPNREARLEANRGQFGRFRARTK
jgi:hypothetical protein